MCPRTAPTAHSPSHGRTSAQFQHLLPKDRHGLVEDSGQGVRGSAQLHTLLAALARPQPLRYARPE